MPYQTSSERKSSVQLGVGRPQWTNTPLVPERVLDGIPGFLAWLALILVVVGTYVAPWVVFSTATILAIYTAGRMLFGALANVVGLRQIKKWERINWHDEYTRIRDKDSLNWSDVLHVIVIPNYKEELVILRRTLTRLASSPIARDQVVIMLAMEAGELEANSKAQTLQAEFSGAFKQVLFSLHPKGLSGEIQGKSANENWAARIAKRQLVDEMGYNLDDLVVTVCDADSLIHERYLECVTALFATSKLRYSTTWQAPIRYHSNVWDIHPSIGIIQAYSAAWELAYLSAPWWHPVPISTYSLSLRMADEVGYWDSDVIAEDLHMFIKCFFRREAKLHLGRVFLPFSGSSVSGDTLLEACKNRYQQTLRHAWGAKEIGFTLAHMIERPEIAPLRGFQMLFRVAHDNILAGAGWIIMTLGQIFPLLFAGIISAEIRNSPQAIALSISYVVIGLLGLVFWIIDLNLRPPREKPWTIPEVAETGVSFALLAVLTLILVALPVMQAQTQLLLGLPIQYRVARKI